MIKIGILPTYNENKERPFINTQSFVNSYTSQIKKSKGIPIGILFPNAVFDEKHLEIYDGFLLPGGKTIRLYHILTIHYAYIHNKPLIGICMGMQAIGIYANIINILNKHNKQLTYQNITKEFKKINEKDYLLEVKNHNKIDPFYKSKINNSLHKIYIKKNTKLYDIYKNKIISMPSIHNYVLKNIPKEFIINATSKEGYIEGIEHQYKPIIGLQFHPELEDNNIFKYLINSNIINKKE